ncbi:3-deoxy-7-phosphoheptulonate synthase [Pseudomonadota bacterium]
MDLRIENLNIDSETEIVHPDQIKAEYPLTPGAVETVMAGQRTIKNILDGTDPRMFVVVGPCSIHDVNAAREYAQKLKTLADEVQETLFLIMRVYFEKPRTSVGWQGLIADPSLDDSYNIEEGIRVARELLIDIADLGVPTAGEALDLVTPQYIQDLFSWTAIGARTTESQTHRKMASGFSSSVGFKNGTNGDYDVAINAILAAAHENNFVSINPQGNVAIVRTKGNPHSHIVLRGGHSGPNYNAKHIAACEKQLGHAGLPQNIMIDCSHANSHKVPDNQLLVIDDVAQQIKDGNQSIKGIMIESNLNAGNQNIPKDLSELVYGVSVTDACIDWASTETALKDLHNKLKGVRS